MFLFQEPERQTRPQDTTDQLVKWMNKRKVRSFYTPLTADSLRAGAQYLMQVCPLIEKQFMLIGEKQLHI